MEAKEKLRSALETVLKTGALKKITLSRPTDKDVLRAECRLITIKDQVFLQEERFLTDGKALHKNLRVSEAAEYIMNSLDAYRQLNIISTGGVIEARVSSKGKLLVSGKISGGEAVAPKSHDRDKSNILKEGNIYPFLVALGVSDEDGRVFDKKRAKFRQIDRFLHYIHEVSVHLSSSELYVLDLCCGKSYLTFAAYWYLTEILGKTVKMVGADRKADVIAFCSDISHRLGYDGLSFECCDITAFVPERSPDLVLSLHACDIATDIVHMTALKLGAKVILSTPCCQHQVFGQLSENKAELNAFAPLLEHSLISQKIAVALTDALRCKRLQACGYSVDVTELIDPENTPKNLMIRAIKKNMPEKEMKKHREEFIRLSELFKVKIHGCEF